jgi:hypothetical protein
MAKFNEYYKNGNKLVFEFKVDLDYKNTGYTSIDLIMRNADGSKYPVSGSYNTSEMNKSNGNLIFNARNYENIQKNILSKVFEYNGTVTTLVIQNIIKEVTQYEIDNARGIINNAARTTENIMKGAGSPETAPPSVQSIASINNIDPKSYNPNFTLADDNVNIQNASVATQTIPNADNINGVGNATSSQVSSMRPESANTVMQRDDKIAQFAKIGGDRADNLQHVMTGADLSVFFLMEVPVLGDVTDGIPKHLWRKELLMMELDSVMSISYSILREVFPVRVIGESKPRSFTRGPMSIAGHIAFTIFTDDVLVRLRSQMVDKFKNLQIRNDEIAASLRKDMPDEYKSVQVNIRNQYNTFNNVLNYGNVYLLNQLLPFHLLVMGVNEQGDFCKMMIRDVYVIDENQYHGTSQPNIMNKITFSATDIYPMTSGSVKEDGTTSTSDQSQMRAQKFSTYSGSQVMNDVSNMLSNNLKQGN